MSLMVGTPINSFHGQIRLGLIKDPFLDIDLVKRY